LLIKGRAKLNIQNIDKVTPLEIAAKTGHEEIVEMLRRGIRTDTRIS